METVTIVGTCGVCEREISVRDNVLVHHGYQRPGDGQIYGDCFGVGYPPLERSTQASINYRATRQREATQLTSIISALKNGETIVVQRPTYMRGPESLMTFVAGVTDLEHFRTAVDSEIRDLKGRKDLAESEIRRMDRLIAEWKLEELGTETRRGAAARAATAARKTEREARLEIRRAKTRVREEKIAVRKAKETEIKARYLTELEALAEKAEAIDALGDLATIFEAKQIIERMKREMKRVPRVRFYVRDLKQDALFIRLGLARRDPSGYISFDFRLDD